MEQYIYQRGVFSIKLCQNQNESTKWISWSVYSEFHKRICWYALDWGCDRKKCFLSMHSEWKSVSTESNPWQWRRKYREANNRRRTLSSLTRLNVFSSEGGRFQKESLQDSLQHLWHLWVSITSLHSHHYQQVLLLCVWNFSWCHSELWLSDPMEFDVDWRVRTLHKGLSRTEGHWSL